MNTQNFYDKGEREDFAPENVYDEDSQELMPDPDDEIIEEFYELYDEDEGNLYDNNYDSY